MTPYAPTLLACCAAGRTSHGVIDLKNVSIVGWNDKYDKTNNNHYLDINLILNQTSKAGGIDGV